MNNLIDLRPELRRRRRRRHPVHWAARVAWDLTASAFLFPPVFLTLLTVALLARVPLRWGLFDAARTILRIEEETA